MPQCLCCEILKLLAENTDSSAEAAEILERVLSIIVRQEPPFFWETALNIIKSNLDLLVFEGQDVEVEQDTDLDHGLDHALDAEPDDKLH